MTPTEYLDLPDFLDSVANAEAANGNDINAAEFRRRAEQARDLQRAARQIAHDRDTVYARLARARSLLSNVDALVTVAHDDTKAA